jgi:hypothetical protein
VGTLFGAVAFPVSFVSSEGPGFKVMSASILAGGSAVLAAGIVLLVRSRTRLRFDPPAHAKAPPRWTGAF